MSDPADITQTDIAIIGNGPAGLIASLAIAKATKNLRQLSVGPPPPPLKTSDTRTTALMTPSITLLRNVGLWEALARRATPLENLRILDATGRLLRAPEVFFQASELQAEPFGYNIRNTDLVAALRDAIDNTPAITCVETAAVCEVTANSDSVIARTKEGLTFNADLVIGADGRRSICREAAGISVKSWRYPQMAIACDFAHSHPHRNTSTEFHTPDGPVTTVPLEGNRSSLVWVLRPQRADILMASSDADFRQRLESRLDGLLGRISEIGRRAAFPLSGQQADIMGRKRIALLGEAGHVLPPIGAQGLNLSFRDAAWLADCIATAHATGQPPGHPDVLQNYDQNRRLDITERVTAVDLLNRSLLSSAPPVHLARGFGLHLLKHLPALRRLAMTRGLQPMTDLPPLMQPTRPIEAA